MSTAAAGGMLSVAAGGSGAGEVELGSATRLTDGEATGLADREATELTEGAGVIEDAGVTPHPVTSSATASAAPRPLHFIASR
ncbi:MAG: hypothetical protein WAS07_15555 [Micropruina sp.]|nr:hypothetical protein [Micropruina sp.]